VSRKKGDSRLARLRTLIGRATQRCGERAAALQQAHTWLCEIARRLEPTPDPTTGERPTGAQVRQRVETYLDECAAAVEHGAVPNWLHQPVAHLGTVVRRLGDGLYQCYDVPGLPRTDNDLENFYRRLKAGERRTTGRRRSDTFVVRVGGFAVYAVAASEFSEAALNDQLTGVSATDWCRERKILRANQQRQTKMRRFRLRRDAYLADLEARWARLSETGPP
jgi:hypothetical protein